MAMMLDIRGAEIAIENLKASVQAGKVRASRKAIAEPALSDSWKDKKNIVSYVTSTNPKNRQRNLETFYSSMIATSDKTWDKKFIHLRSDRVAGGDYSRIAKAAAMAMRIVEEQNRKYPKYYYKRGNSIYRYPPSSPGLRKSVRTYVNLKDTRTPFTDIKSSKDVPMFEITNIAAYGSTAESEALTRAKIGGIIFFAAQRVQRAFPDLGVLFYYSDSADYGVTDHFYKLPVLVISSDERVRGRGQARSGGKFTRNKWSRPGYNFKKRKGERRRIRRAIERAVGKDNVREL